VLGVVLFREKVDLSAAALAGESFALIVIAVSVIFLSQSPLVRKMPFQLVLSATPQID
jgi:hypothetical protein